MLARINANVRLDDNDEACALILVRTAETGLGFAASSGIVGNVEWKNGDYWVYVSQGNRTIKIYKKGIKTIEYILPIIPKSKETYLLVLDVVRPKPKVPVWPVTIITQPENATITIDGQTLPKGNKIHKLKEGTHTIRLEMPGYETVEKTITVNDNSVYFNFKLNETLNVALMIESDPPGATVYLDGVKLGITPFSKFYPPGTYPVKVQKEGYVPIEGQTLTVTSPETRKKFTLAENVGYVTINTYETAKVYINGTEYTEHTNLKLPAQVLDIKITMPKAAALEKQIVLKRNDRLTFDLYPEVQTGTIQVAVTPFDANIELTGDAGEHYTAQGMHIFRDIPVGNYTLTVKAEGYRTATKTITLNANGILNENIKLEEGPSGDIEMVFVKGGTFQMGCTSEQSDCYDDEKPVHTVTVGDFYIGKYEITQKQWRDVMGTNPANFSGCDDCPVESVSWNDVQEFIKKLNEKTSLHYRLPTEAEWEYCARLEKTGMLVKYPWGNKFPPTPNSGNFGDKSAADLLKVYLPDYNDGYAVTAPPQKFKANFLGLFDMGGNAAEWCHDYYSIYPYQSGRQYVDPLGPGEGKYHVVRGSSWQSAAITTLRLAYRDYSAGRRPDLGFRICRYAKP